MNTMLIRERYKVVRVLESDAQYACVEAVDIQERETPSRLVNLYEGALLHRYGRICTAIAPAECPSLRGMFLTGETLAVVFDDCGGTPIDQVFHRGDAWPWRQRLEWAGRLLHRALELANLPPEAACAALLSDNVLLDVGAKQVRLRFLLRPLPELTARELVLLAGDQVKKILPRRWNSLEAQLDFLEELDAGVFRSIVPLYARWREAEAAIRAEREAYEKRTFVGRGLQLLRLRLRRLRKGRGQR